MTEGRGLSANDLVALVADGLAAREGTPGHHAEARTLLRGSRSALLDLAMSGLPESMHKAVFEDD